MSVGHHIVQAVERALAREASCARKLTIRLHLQFGAARHEMAPGLVVRGHIAARSADEMEHSSAMRLMLWSELDHEAQELPRLVDEVADELEHRFGIDGAAA